VRVIAWVRLLTSVFVASLLCLHSRSTAQETKLIRIHEGKHWVWFARSDQFESYRQDIERFYDYADKAFEYLCEAWGLKLPREKYVLFV
jgi:hypothetical protein